MTAPEYRTQVKRWFVETGFCDGGGMGHWIETEESVEVAGEAEANALRDSWLASGKLRTMPWGELRPQNSYALFRIRQVWEDTRAPLAEALAVPTEEPEAGEERAVIVRAKWKPCVHGGGWWVAQDADGREVLLAPDGFADLAEALEVPEVAALVYAAKMVMHDLHHGNGLEGLYANRDRLDAGLHAIGGDA